MRKLANKVVVTYYDSLVEVSEISAAVADHVLECLASSWADEYEFPTVVPVRSNTRSSQINGVDCGFFAMRFWEGEVRKFIG